jgi:hypothetical protein
MASSEWYLQNLAGGSDGLINIRCLPPRGCDGPAINKFFGPKSLGKAIDWCEEMKHSHDVYAGVLTREWPDGGARAVPEARWLYTDIDAGSGTLKDCGRLLEGAGFPRPEMIILSGSGGMHAYWRLKAPFEFAGDDDRRLYKKTLKCLCERINLKSKDSDGPHADASKADIGAILRVPGTYNHKWEPPRETIAIECPSKPHSFSKWVDFLGVAEEIKSTRHPLTPKISGDIEGTIRSHLEKWVTQPISEGGRHNDLTSKANWLGKEKNFEYREVLSWLQIKAANCPGSRIPDTELERIARYACKG